LWALLRYLTLEAAMPYQTIRLSKRDAIAYLDLQRPKQGNRIDSQLLQELAAACAEIEDDPQVRVAVLSGGDASVFSLGWDKSLLAAESEPARRQESRATPSIACRSYRGRSSAPSTAMPSALAWSWPWPATFVWPAPRPISPCLKPPGA
jgi:hypothetical protein